MQQHQCSLLPTHHHTHPNAAHEPSVCMQAVHVAHTAEMQDLLARHVGDVFDDWETLGAYQPGEYTTATLWKTHFEPPWNRWAIGSYDSIVHGSVYMPGMCGSGRKCIEAT